MSELPQAVGKFIDAINKSRLDDLIALFTDDALVNDKHRHFWGKDAVRRWSETEIIKQEVAVELYDVVEHYGDSIVTLKMGGKFDKTLFDTFVVNSSITVLHGTRPEALLCLYFSFRGGKIAQLIITPIDGSSPILTDETAFYVPSP